MEQSYLMPGQERWESFRDANGVPKVRYSYCSLKGRLFRCVSRSREEAEERRRGISGSTLETVTHSGHMIPLEQPKALARVMTEWLAERLAS